MISDARGHLHLTGLRNKLEHSQLRPCIDFRSGTEGLFATLSVAGQRQFCQTQLLLEYSVKALGVPKSMMGLCGWKLFFGCFEAGILGKCNDTGENGGSSQPSATVARHCDA